MVDVETTGLDPERDEVISFAGIPVEAARIIAREAATGWCDRAPAAGQSVEIHRLRAEDLAAAPGAPRRSRRWPR